MFSTKHSDATLKHKSSLKRVYPQDLIVEPGAIRPGDSFPLGATVRDGGIN